MNFDHYTAEFQENSLVSNGGYFRSYWHIRDYVGNVVMKDIMNEEAAKDMAFAMNKARVERYDAAQQTAAEQKHGWTKPPRKVLMQ